ncbi:hypothetical protein PC113_g4309 [Phytophthora cactorum]|uniref:ATP-binding cassette (ABC) Superfamily n=1 Tax=Phytophthora cactorum TaxID=29920 RepID=A0A8T1EBJ1_9STRA|nr:hypothetical protein PC112_g1485 [Phytophthora cactorum]KAG2864738.1 hypothetical protein PC113_g4309 [Phytophthora cactorum]KAG2908824.1 hypothetical protein PC114_g10297 [Phytophthora cactorum]KAG2950514.1 hypothetical protein PC117_g4393 [Phytophthora cactorum]
MPHVGVSRGAKAHAKSAATKQQTKSSEPRGKGSALQEATEVASKAVTSSGDAPADTGASSRRSRSPSLPKDDCPNPRFAVREHSPGTVAEAMAKHDGSRSEEATGGRTPLPSEGGRESVHSLGSDHGGHSPMRPADEAMDSSNTRADEDDKTRRVLRNLSFSEGRERAQAAKAAAEQSKHTKKRHASRSPRCEALETEVDPYKNLFVSDSDEEEEEGAVNEPQEISNDFDRQQEDFQAAQRVRRRPTTGSHSPGHDRSPSREGVAPHPRGYWPPEPSPGAELYLEQLVAPRGLIGGHTSKGAYERTLVQRNPLFTENIEAARCVLLAPHRIPLKEFTTRCKKPENRGGLRPVWGYPWVCPENCQSWGAADLLFWKWVASHSYSQEMLRELQQDLLLSYILNQRNLRIEFVHLVSKRLLPKDFQKRAASSAQGERGYELYASAPIPRSGKKARTTHEAAAASVPRSRHPLGSQPGAAQSAPTSSVSRGIPATSPGAGAFHQGAARGRHAPRGSGSLHYGRGEVEEPSFDFEYEAPPAGRSSRLSAPLATVTQPQNAEIDRLRQRVLVLEIALGLGTGGDAAAQAGNRGVLAKIEDRLHQLGRTISGLHDRVGRRAPSSDVDEAFRQLQQVRGALRDLAPRTETHSYGYAQPYSQPYGYGGYSAYLAGAIPYGAPPAYQTPRGPPTPRGSWPYAAGRSTTSEADSRFEEFGPPPRGTPVASGERQAPVDHDTASDDPHKCRVRLH